MENKYIAVDYKSGNVKLPPYFLINVLKNELRKNCKSVDEKTWQVDTANYNKISGWVKVSVNGE